MSKQKLKTLLGEVTLKSGRKFPVNLGTNFSADTKTLSEQVIGLSHMNGNKIILLGSQIETIEAWEGEVEVEVPDQPAITLETKA